MSIANIASISSPRVYEGETLVFDIKLSTPTRASTAFEFSLKDGSAQLDSDYTRALQYSINGGLTWVDVPSSLRVDIPADIASLLVRTPTVADLHQETLDESLSLSVYAGDNTVTANGTLIADEAPAQISRVVALGPVMEGQWAEFTLGFAQASHSLTPVTLALSAGSAALGSDFTALYEVNMGDGFIPVTGDQFILKANLQSAQVRVRTTDDLQIEGNESFVLSASTPVGSASGEVLVIDNDTAAVGYISSPVATEGAPLVFDLSLAQASPTDTAVQLNLRSATATIMQDFESTMTYSVDGGITWLPVGDSINIPAGVVNFKVSVPTKEDITHEFSETLTLSALSAGGGATATGRIVDNDSAPKVSKVTAGPGAPEGEDLWFDVSLSHASTLSTSVTLAVSEGSARLDTDFIAQCVAVFPDGTSQTIGSGGTVNVPGGVTEFKVKVPTTIDAIIEGPETLTLTASTPTGAISAEGQIFDREAIAIGSVMSVAQSASDAPPAMAESAPAMANSEPVIADSPSAPPSVSPVQIVEGGDAVFAVNLVRSSPIDTKVFLALSGNGRLIDDVLGSYEVSFDGGQHYASTSSPMTIPANSQSFLIKVRTVDDAIFEGQETLNLTVSSLLSTTTGTVTIRDNEATPTVSSVSNTAASEGDALTFDVSLSHASVQSTRVSLTLSDGTATLGADYASALQVSFDGGKTYAAVTNGAVDVPASTRDFKVRVATLEDTTFESDEKLTLRAAVTPDNASSLSVSNAASASGTGVILNDDIADMPNISINNVTFNENGASAREEYFTVTLSKAAAVDIVIHYRTEDGTAVADESLPKNYTYYSDNSTIYGGQYDYVPVEGSLTIKAGQTTAKLPFEIFDDVRTENAEQFFMRLTGASFGKITDNLGTCTIPRHSSPLVLDLNGDGVQSVGYASGVQFDNDDEGVKHQIGWASQQDGLLARDLNGDGQINDGKELFGAGTNLAATGNKALDGFQALAELDSDADGDVDASDSAFSTLRIWRDADTDAVTDSGELITLSDAGIARLSLGYTTHDDDIQNGNLHWLHGSYETTSGQTREMTDVYFEKAPNALVDAPAQALETAQLTAIAEVQATEGSALVFNLAFAQAMASETTVLLRLENETANIGEDLTLSTEVSFDSGNSWQNVEGQLVNVPAGASAFQLRYQTVNDSTFEADETFRLRAFAGETEVSAIATIVNDDTEVMPEPPASNTPPILLDDSDAIPLDRVQRDMLTFFARQNKDSEFKPEPHTDDAGHGKRGFGQGTAMISNKLPQFSDLIRQDDDEVPLPGRVDKLGGLNNSNPGAPTVRKDHSEFDLYGSVHDGDALIHTQEIYHW